MEQPEHDRGYERFNIAPTQEVLAVVEDEDGRRMDLLRWGLVPRWAKDLKVGYRMINARAETLGEKPAYRGLVRHAKHRCLILADGYYEWQKPEDPQAAAAAAALLAGRRRAVLVRGPLDQPARSRRSGAVPSCTIVTCAANELTRPIHDRMPVILAGPEAWEAWLDPAVPASRGL